MRHSGSVRAPLRVLPAALVLVGFVLVVLVVGRMAATAGPDPAEITPITITPAPAEPAEPAPAPPPPPEPAPEAQPPTGGDPQRIDSPPRDIDDDDDFDDDDDDDDDDD